MLLPIKNSRKPVFFGYGTKVLKTELNCRFFLLKLLLKRIYSVPREPQIPLQNDLLMVSLQAPETPSFSPECPGSKVLTKPQILLPEKLWNFTTTPDYKLLELSKCLVFERKWPWWWELCHKLSAQDLGTCETCTGWKKVYTKRLNKTKH